MKKFNSNILLRFGLGFVFLYAGIAAFVQPEMWIGFVPSFIENIGISRELALYGHALGDITLGVLFLAGIWKKLVGLSAFALLLVITLINGPELFIVTFRDVGLALAALAYAFME